MVVHLTSEGLEKERPLVAAAGVHGSGGRAPDPVRQALGSAALSGRHPPSSEHFHSNIVGFSHFQAESNTPPATDSGVLRVQFCALSFSGALKRWHFPRPFVDSLFRVCYGFCVRQNFG